jgi:hypothetical protein
MIASQRMCLAKSSSLAAAMIPLENNDCSLLFGRNMLKRVLVCAAFDAVVTAGSVNAQQPSTEGQGIKPALQQKVQVPGANHELYQVPLIRTRAPIGAIRWT